MGKIALLLACIITCIFLGSLPSIFTIEAIRDWYPTLNKPSWNPPSWLFGPVWTILFTLMGIALHWIILAPNNPQKHRAIRAFIIQFGLNVIWSILFFSLHRPQHALIEIFVLLALIIITIKKFGAINKKAAYLLIPYLAWVSFATILNATIVWLNKDLFF